MGLSLMDLVLGATPGSHTDTYKNKTKGTRFFRNAKISITVSLNVTAKETNEQEINLKHLRTRTTNQWCANIHNVLLRFYIIESDIR